MIKFSSEWFFDLENKIREMHADSDAQSFYEIKENLSHPKKFNSTEFADMCVYVILAGGFSQKTAKRIHAKICDCLHTNGVNVDNLLALFNNKNKINAIVEIWNNKDALCGAYYALHDFDDKIKFLESLPHIGKITANHLARNLGENVVKYDIWIQRLGCAYKNKKFDIDNGKLKPEIKKVCDEMFAHLHNQTNLPVGYIDVVLWKGAQLGLIEL